MLWQLHTNEECKIITLLEVAISNDHWKNKLHLKFSYLKRILGEITILISLENN